MQTWERANSQQHEPDEFSRTSLEELLPAFLFSDRAAGQCGDLELRLFALASGEWKVELTHAIKGETRALYFTSSGAATQGMGSGEVLDTPLEMETRCSILNTIYNNLEYEYTRAQTGEANTDRIYWAQCFFKNLMSRGLGQNLSVQLGFKDPALNAIQARIIDVDQDESLTYEERQKLISAETKTRDRICKTKARAHGNSVWIHYRIPLFFQDRWLTARRLTGRPGSTIAGVSYKYTIGLVLTFISIIRNNIGYSIAIALYAPFTFYFITQPINPRAMAAVAKVRSAYLAVVERVEDTLQTSSSSADRRSPNPKTPSPE